jgi:MFS family permease
VYEVSNSSSLVQGHKRLLGRRREGTRVNRTVVMLGLCSMFTDISSEMITTVLPLYLVFVGGFSPLAFGFIDGIQQGAASIVRLASGFVGDRWHRHKEVATAGYALSSICKLALAAAGTAVSTIGAIVLVDRIGKGIRTAPRDAMISLSTERDQLGTAFGVHRALDTTGAMIGPIVAFAILTVAPLGFDTIFLVAFLISLIGLAILVLFVEPRPAETRSEADEAAAVDPADVRDEPRRASLRRALALLKVRRFRGIVLAGSALSLATVSDAFVFLILQEKLDLELSLFPLLFIGSAGTFMLLAVPMGRIADRVGRGRVLLAGYGVLLGVYAALLSGIGGTVLLVATLGLLGTYYAATDGVLMALGSTVVPGELRGSGLALLGTATNVGRLLASIAFGALWTWTSIETAFAVFAVMLVAAVALAMLALVRSREPAHA